MPFSYCPQAPEGAEPSFLNHDEGDGLPDSPEVL